MTVSESAVTRVDNHATITIGEDSHDTNTVTNPLPPKTVNVNDSTTPTDDGLEVKVGDKLHYHVDYVNTTSAQVDSVTITDVVPTGTDYVEGSADNGGTYDAATKTVTWTLGPVAAGASVRVSFAVTVSESAVTRVDNHATIDRKSVV